MLNSFICIDIEKCYNINFNLAIYNTINYI